MRRTAPCRGRAAAKLLLTALALAAAAHLHVAAGKDAARPSSSFEDKEAVDLGLAHANEQAADAKEMVGRACERTAPYTTQKHGCLVAARALRVQLMNGRALSVIVGSSCPLMLCGRPAGALRQASTPSCRDAPSRARNFSTSTHPTHHSPAMRRSPCCTGP